MTHRQACEDLGIDLDQFEEWKEQKRVLPLFMTNDQEPCKQWIDAASAFVQRAERYLWTEKGIRAREYLHGRGLTEDTIQQYHIGYCPGWYSENLANWGLTSIQTDGQEEIKIPEGITLPWFVEGKIWKISVRRWSEGYFQVLGSSDCLYTIDAIKQEKSNIMLVESEIDALSVHQEASDIISCIATGGTSKGQSQRWINHLKQAPGILIGFDADEAGENGSVAWLKKIPQALRWKPWSHDANQMLQEKMPVRTWVEMGLRALHTQIESPASELEIPQSSQISQEIPTKEAYVPTKKRKLDPWIQTNKDTGLPTWCSQCRNRAIAWKSNSETMQAFCEQHKPLNPGR